MQNDQSEVHSCLLRRLTLCDGERSCDPLPRAHPTGCYCLAIGQAVVNGDDETAQQLRIDRARVVAQQEPIAKLLARRQPADW